MAPDYPLWIRLLLRAASRRASDAALGDVMEEYTATGRSASWLVSQVVSIVRRGRSHLTIRERAAEMLSNVLNDIRYALRTLARNPGFAIAAIVPIALGIGINTGVFSILNSVAWRSLPVPDADALVSVYQDFRGGPRRTIFGARTLFSIPEYRTYRDGTRTLSGVMAYSREWTVNLGGESAQEITGVLVTCNYFNVLRLPAAIGTGFTPANCGTSDAAPVVVLSHALWTTAFRGDPQILYKPIVLDGRDVTVVGVAAAGFDGIDMAKASFFAPTWMAGVLRPEQHFHENANVSWLTLIGRRQGNADLAQVRADLSLIARRIDQQQVGRTTSLIVEPAAALSLPPARRNILRGATVAMTAFGLVLLIAAANVANMLLARAANRTREIAIRISVGAKRRRLVQQLLTESAVIAMAGALGGSLLFWWSFQVLIRWVLTSLPDGELFRIDAIPDRTVFWFALGLTVVTTLVFGLLPALQASSVDVHAVMKDGAESRARRGWLRGALVGGQIAFCTMLLIPAGLLSRALYAAHTLDPGFDHRNVAVVSIDLRGPRYEQGNAALFQQQWLDRVRAVPGLERIAQASRIPLSPGRSQTTLRVGGESEGHVADVNAVSPEFFSVLRIPIVRGRAFTNSEPDAVLVTEPTARRYWAGRDAIGGTVMMDGRRRYIVGIVQDTQVAQAQEAVSSYVYLPATRDSPRGISIVARTRTSVAEFAAAVRAETARLDRTLLVRVQPLSDNLALLQTLSQITAGVAGLLSLLALGLAAVGIYGVVAYVVTRRRREVGIRMALGATVGDVRRLIARQTLRPVAVGLAIGIAVAAAAARVLQSVLFGVSPFDPLAYLGAPLVMIAVAGLATWLPTRQALQSDPIATLRSE